MALRADIPRYEVLDLLGEGALATVYKARAKKDGSIRALKALKPEQAGTDRALERFADEYRILSALHHPCLPEVYDYGFAPGGAPFIVMEFLEGTPLDEYLREHPSDLWLLLFQINEALAFIHEHDLLHLDLKPSNVLVRPTRLFGDEEDPLAVLIDFGLSYRRDVGGAVKLVGTPAYMAPEIVRGEENLTRAVDYYSLGVVIYELIEGQLPFRGSIHDILRSHLAEEVTFERRRVEHAELQPWVEKLMSKEPRERLEAFQGFRRAVEARLGEKVDRLERVFALGYIESLGLVGKEEVWKELRSWASGLGRAITERKKLHEAPLREMAPGSVRRGGVAEPPPAEPGDVLKGSVTSLEERIRQDLLSRASTHAPEQRPEPIDSIPRVLAVTGPPESGKSHALSALKTELRARGVGVVSLGRESDYQMLVGHAGAGKTARSQDVDPSALVIDRFNAGWEELSRQGSESGVVVIVDDLEGASAEEKEFIEYVGKRAGQEMAERKEPGVFIVAVGREADVKGALEPILMSDAVFAALQVPPPGKNDADSIAGSFRGHLSGVKEEKSLASFLETNLHTSASLYQSLKHAVNEGFFVLSRGRWEFHEGQARPLARADETGGYYQEIVRNLTGPPREVVALLACHPLGLTVDRMSEVSGLTTAAINEAVETIKPHRIIDVAEIAGGRSLDVVSDPVRTALCRAFGKKERDRIHKRFVGYYGARPEPTIAYWEIMSHHSEQLGLAREALVARIRAIAIARKAMDVFALRRLCGAGVTYARRLQGAEWAPREWLIERFFLKQWITGEDRLANYRNVVSIVEENLIRRKREVPTSFLYKYAVALERVGRRDECDQVLNEGETKLSRVKSETYYLLLLQHARTLLNAGMFNESLEKLEQINKDLLPLWARALRLVTLLVSYEPLGREEDCRRVTGEAKNLPREPELVDQLLRVEYNEIRRMLAAGTYSAAKQVIRRGMRLAVKHKAYRSLCSMYFIASALYYEIGDYGRATRFLDRTIRLAKENVLPELVYDYLLRHALISEKLGLFGNAIENAESVARATSIDRARQQYFSSLVALLRVFVAINSSRADDLIEELARTAKGIESRYRLASYHRALGRYHAKAKDLECAMSEFDTARHLFLVARMFDDLAETETAMASVLVAQGRLGEAEELLTSAKTAIDKMESNELRARYLAVELQRRVREEARVERILQCMDLCSAARPRVAEVEVALDLDAELFKSAIAIGDLPRALAVFDRYYDQVRCVVGNLPKEYVADFVKDPQLTETIESYRRVKTQDPGQR
jgi:serine/threonine protein kinase/tetratricopeptide (TPR) repeat protein